MSAYDDFREDVGTNDTAAPHLRTLLGVDLSRRGVLAGTLATAVGFLSASVAAPAAAGPDSTAARGRLLGFEAIPLGYGDDHDVAPGYRAVPFIPWGTPLLGDYPTFRPGRNTAQEQAQQVGMHHDGMHYFPLQGSRRGLLVVNHEYTDEALLQTGTTQRPPREAITREMVRKSQHAHGVSVVEVERDAQGEWTVVRSRKNRRITARTPMAFSGPAAGHRLLRTAADPAGRHPRGTFNNCSNGHTPWGTYLTCEENFNGYFAVEPGDYDPEVAALTTRYGVGGDSYYWAEKDDRFRLTPEDPNEANRFGWVVEFDPNDPTSTPVKRTALGRAKHEGAFVHVTKGDRVVVYMGDDQVNEYAYKFVSSGGWKSMLACGQDPLDSGTLFVARFDADGRGRWLPLVHGRPGLTAAEGFADQGDVLVKTRLAASSVGATPMHRPEWTSVDPNTGAVYLSLSNDGGSPAAVRNAANPRVPDTWGSVIRWYEDDDDHAARRFSWDHLVLAGQGRGTGDGSTVQSKDAFGSPDGLWVDRDSRVWIQTDGTQPLGANDQMLAANPFATDAAGVPQLKRFFTGVGGGEVTGVIDTPDQRTMFINIQHPGDGEDEPSTWPRMDGYRVPRSATVVITKVDGGVIGT